MAQPFELATPNGCLVSEVLSRLTGTSISFSSCSSFSRTFDTAPTPGIIWFEIFVMLGTIATILLLSRIVNRLLLRYFITVIGVIIFEFFTAPMWNNFKMGTWAYMYRDVSWILTFGWTSMILFVVLIVDKFLPRLSETKRSLSYLLSLTVLVFIFESIVISLGIRSYSPEVKATLVGYNLFLVPVEILYYVPVFTALVISFYKYWSFVVDGRAVVPVKRIKWLTNLAITFVGVFFFELVIEPMVTNTNFPSWSYVYRDISLLMTGSWVVIIWLAITLVDRYLLRLDLVERFVCYTLIIGAVALPTESWLIANGFRVYGPSATANFSGLTLPLFGVPVEVAFAIPLYLGLIVAFTRYWQIVRDNGW